MIWRNSSPLLALNSGLKADPTLKRHTLIICVIQEVIEYKKLTYSWSYEGYEGNSFVTFELYEEGNSTTLKLTHAGLETFPANNPDFAASNFVAGWTELIDTSLKKFVEE